MANVPTNAEILKQAILNIKDRIDSAKNKRYIDVQIAENTEREKIKPLQEYLDAVLNRFKDRAIELVEESGEYPRDNLGYIQSPTDVRISESNKGVVVEWDINGCGAPYVFLATWEELIKQKDTDA